MTVNGPDYGIRGSGSPAPPPWHQVTPASPHWPEGTQPPLGPPVTPPSTQPITNRPEFRRVALAAAAGAVAALILWFLVHDWSLLFDAVIGVWVGSTAVSGWKVAGGTAADRVEALWKIPQLPKPLPLVVAGLACVPFVVGLLSLTVTELHHSSRGDVCSALSAYQAASSNESESDDAWFAALDKVGNTAADYAGPDQAAVNASGKTALQLANGNGQSDFVMTSVGQADAALGPVMELCDGDE